MKQNILDFFKIMNIIIYISFLQCFLGFEVYWDFIFKPKSQKGFKFNKKIVNVIFIYIKVIFSNIFFKLLKNKSFNIHLKESFELFVSF